MRPAATVKSVGVVSTTCTAWHLLPAHVPPRQLWPHAPQLAALVVVFTQPLPQTVSFAAQVTQLPAMQAAPATHWVFVVQLVTQSVVPHTNGLQGCVVEAAQAPAPLHPAMLVAVPLAQLGWRQTV